MSILFSHIQKTGGLQFYSKIIANYGRKNVILVGSIETGGDIDAKNINRLELNDFINVEAIIGHISLIECEKNDNLWDWVQKKEPKVISIVRDPIERVVSLYKYIKELKKHPLNKKINSISFHDFAASMPNDIQTRWINSNFTGNKFEYKGRAQLRPIIFKTDNVTSILGEYLIDNNIIQCLPEPTEKNETKKGSNDVCINKTILQYYESGLDFKLVNSLD